MSAFYKHLLNFKGSQSLSTPVLRDTQERKPHYSLDLSTFKNKQQTKKKQKKSVRFPPNVLMQQAITNGDVQEMKRLITDYGKEVVNAPEPTGLPPVMRCIFEGQMAPLRFLVAAGADLAAQDSENWTALHVAASMDDKYAAKLILNLCKTCLISVCNMDGETPIDLAESNSMANLLNVALVTSAHYNHT